MAQQSLTVSFDGEIRYDHSDVPSPFRRSGGDVLVAGRGVHTIEFKRAADQDGWKFATFEWTPEQGSGRQTGAGEPVLSVIERVADRILVRDRLDRDGRYKYTIRIVDPEGNEHESDPEIQNTQQPGPRYEDVSSASSTGGGGSG